ncbi:MAG: MBL fold metallo-hydrolase [Proteobacteria bacterium]|nr:MBL fold metallo-hydrolase [Pseudomonadota bacterium]
MPANSQNSRVVILEQDLELLQIPVLQDNYIYILHDHKTQLSVAIDPAEASPVIACLEARAWRLDFIWNTHHHPDHVGGNLELKDRYNCRILGSRYDKDRIPGLDHLVDDANEFRFGSWTIKVLATPGHTLGHCIYHIPDADLLFCGDTLFSLGCGRLFEGSPDQMWESRPSMQKALGLKAVPANEVFAKLRKGKDNFKG